MNASAPRSGRKVVGVVLVLALLVVVALVGGELYARNQLTDQASADISEALGVESEISPGATFVLPSLISGEIGEVHITSDGTPTPTPPADAEAEGIRLLQPALDLRGEGVTRTDETVHLDALSGTVEITNDAMLRAARESTGSGLAGLPSIGEISSDEAAGTLQISLGGLAEATARPEVIGGRLSLDAEGGSLLGMPLPPTLLGGLMSVINTAVGEMPAGLVLESVRVTDSGMLLDVAGQDVTLERTNR